MNLPLLFVYFSPELKYEIKYLSLKKLKFGIIQKFCTFQVALKINDVATKLSLEENTLCARTKSRYQ